MILRFQASLMSRIYDIKKTRRGEMSFKINIESCFIYLKFEVLLELPGDGTLII